MRLTAAIRPLAGLVAAWLVAAWLVAACATDAGNGSAVVWRSTDGRVWIHVPQDVSFSGAGLAAVLGSPRLLVGGTMGWPDTHSAQVWIGPPG
jgi:predicted small secreted protein